MPTFKIVDLLSLPSGNLSALYPTREHENHEHCILVKVNKDKRDPIRSLLKSKKSNSPKDRIKNGRYQISPNYTSDF